MNSTQQPKPTSKLCVSLSCLSRKQSVILNYTLQRMKQRLSSQLPPNPSVSTCTDPPAPNPSTLVQTEPVLQLVEQHVHDQAKAETQLTREKLKRAKDSLKAERDEKVALRAELERVLGERDGAKGQVVSLIEQNSQLKARLDKQAQGYELCQKQLLEAEFRSLHLEQQLARTQTCHREQQTLAVPEPCHLKEMECQLSSTQKIIATLEAQVKTLVSNLSKKDKQLEELLTENSSLRTSKMEQEAEFADMMECFMKEKTKFEEGRRKQVEAQFLEMEKAYRTVFEGSIKLKGQLCEANAEIERLTKAAKETEFRFNLEVADYERRLHQVRNNRELSARNQRTDAELSRLKQQLELRDGQLHQVNLALNKTHSELQDKTRLLKELEAEATAKLTNLVQKYEQLTEYNELLMGQIQELKKKGQGLSGKDTERMRKLYLSIWKDRFSSH